MIGTSLNQYQITASIGAGGMGEVFRARDTRLNRDVAVKVLPKDFAADADRLRRFEQEAKTLAALNHANILTIHDAGVHEGTPYLVSELLRGKTLREEMATGALAVRKVTDYALQIAQGLAAAHGKGVIHRDLKPENLFVTQDGRVKILDFGLAKLKDPSPGLRPPSPLRGERGDAGTIRIDADAIINTTLPGLVLGTPAYMSPEQVRGEPADHRADIFAFGCVLYEMLSGSRAFRRDTPVESMNAILNEERPDLAATNINLSPVLERVVRRCLEKNPENRFQSATDLAFAIEVAANVSSKPEQAGGLPDRPSRKRVLATTVGLCALAFLAGYLANRCLFPARVGTAPSIRYLTYSGRDYSPAASADGKRICFSSDRDGTNRIWIKEIASGWETALTSGPDDFPRFSRDGSAVLFTRGIGNQRSLFRVPAIGGEPSRIVDDAVSGDWSPDGRQVAFVRWAADGSSSIYIVGSDGSAQTLLHRFSGVRCSAPRWARDGTKIGVTINQSGHHQSVAWLSLANQQLNTLKVPNAYNVLSGVVWDIDSRSILYLQAESAQADTSGSPAALFRQSIHSGRFQKLLWCPAYCAVLDLLPSGNAVMDAKSSRQNLKEYRITSSNSAPRSLTLGGSTDRQPVYSPDGKEIVFSSNRSGNLEIWAVSRNSGIVRRLTDHPADDWDPALSPDGRHLIWSANRTGNLEVWIANADGSAPVRVTHEGFAAQNPTMTRDGRWIVYASYNLQRAGLWKIHSDGNGDTPLIRSATVGNAEVSPDGKYAAYREYSHPSLVAVKVVEIESGAEVPFEIPVAMIKETTARLGRVRWMPDGKALAFLGQNQAGVNGVYIQDFVPGKDTTNTRRQLVGFDPENSAESFGISPDGQFITIAAWEQFFSIMVTEDLSPQ
jgi:serine/threonine protein kinase